MYGSWTLFNVWELDFEGVVGIYNCLKCMGVGPLKGKELWEYTINERSCGNIQLFEMYGSGTP